MPAHAAWPEAQLPIAANVAIRITGASDPRIPAAATRLLNAWQERTGMTFPHRAAGPFAFDNTAAPLTISCDAASSAIPQLGEDESYVLQVSGDGATLKAPTTLGVLRGLATLTQALEGDSRGWYLRATKIEDRPRFRWRGLMIDVCRHWQPIDVIKRNLDGMALVKLNVLHLHLTEDQGFRIETKTVPQLAERGSDGLYFTQEQIREIIAYAAERGIRVVPEFDMPGHATSWVVAFPELASAPGPYVIERRWGVFDPVLDPTNEQTYAMLERFLGEMAALFPDPYLHIGGDENNGKQWNGNSRIQAFIREHGLKDNAGLHAYFNQHIRDILQRHGKRLVGWDEILHPDLPKDSVVHSWRGAEGLAAAAGQGYATILSNGYYIDLCHPAADHYRNDPIPADTKLSAAEQERVLGGEATMWAEWVDPETIDSRIWPRTAAIAERLWSPREVNDVGDMYRRLAIVGRRLEEAGLRHERNRPEMIRRFVGEPAAPEICAAVGVLIDAIEPVKVYARGAQQPEMTQLSPLTGLADCARPESDAARRFRDAVDAVLASGDAHAGQLARTTLTSWRNAGSFIVDHAAKAGPRVSGEAVPVATNLVSVSIVGLQALDTLQARQKATSAWLASAQATLANTAKPSPTATELPMLKAVAKLVDAVR